MLDVLHEEGEKACAELKKEFASSDVMFTRCDVTNKNEMVCRRRRWCKMCE